MTEEQRRKDICRSYANVYKRRGHLRPKCCERLGTDCSGPMEMHHEDYSKPLLVRWLCRTHHHIVEREAGLLHSPSGLPR